MFLFVNRTEFHTEKFAEQIFVAPPCGSVSASARPNYPWHSWIARQTPTLKVEGSNPFG